jgi:hypothetical protein
MNVGSAFGLNDRSKAIFNGLLRETDERIRQRTLKRTSPLRTLWACFARDLRRTETDKPPSTLTIWMHHATES